MDNSASFIVGEISVVFNQYQYQYQYHYYDYYNPPENDVVTAATRHRHAIFAFVISVIVGLLQIMYQNKNSSPFQSHPKTMSTAIASLLMYCLASELKFLSTTVVSRTAPNHDVFGFSDSGVFGFHLSPGEIPSGSLCSVLSASGCLTSKGILANWSMSTYRMFELKNAILNAAILNLSQIVPPVLDHHAVTIGSRSEFAVLNPKEPWSLVWKYNIS